MEIKTARSRQARSQPPTVGALRRRRSGGSVFWPSVQAGGTSGRKSSLRLACAALLVHVAEIDGFLSESERRALLLLLQQGKTAGKAEHQSQYMLRHGNAMNALGIADLHRTILRFGKEQELDAGSQCMNPT